MNESDEENEEVGEEEQKPIDKLFESPDVQKGIAEFIKQVPTLIQSWLSSSLKKDTAQSEEKYRSTKWASTAILVAVVTVTVTIIVAVTLLVWNDKLSSEATAFLFGTIIGTVFGVLGRFIGGSN